jgi:hypothetical protein
LPGAVMTAARRAGESNRPRRATGPATGAMKRRRENATDAGGLALALLLLRDDGCDGTERVTEAFSFGFSGFPHQAPAVQACSCAVQGGCRPRRRLKRCVCGERDREES